MQISELAASSRLPVIHDREEFVEGGGLIAYSVHHAEMARRTAAYVITADCLIGETALWPLGHTVSNPALRPCRSRLRS